MTRRRITLAIGLAIPLLCFVLWQTFRSREPLYRGKKVSDWVEIYCRQGTNARVHLRAVCNLIDLGTNAVPYILDMAGTRDSFLKKTFRQIPIPDRVLAFLKADAAYDRWKNAARDRPQMATRAFVLLGRENGNATPGLIRLLSSDNPASRIAAADMLSGVGFKAQEAVPALMSVIARDPAKGVQAAAERALNSIKGLPPSEQIPAVRLTSTRPMAAFTNLLQNQPAQRKASRTH